MRRRLLGWYDEKKRDLPWRGERDPYRIWVSESMLQQTRAETVRERYPLFIARFPSLAALADAPLEAVLSEWQGLGYYARARNLHRAARTVAESCGGRLPEHPEELRRLPGFGPYMAGAVGSIAFGLRAAAVDGNVLRVLSRLLDEPAPVDEPAGRAALAAEAEALVPRKRPGDFNQALMDLGARICLPRRPACPDCPLEGICSARAAGTVLLRPVKKRKKPPREVTALQLWAEKGGALFLVRRPRDGLFGGLWELPGVMEEVGGEVSEEGALLRACERWLGRGWRTGEEIVRLRRTLTHRRILFVVRRALPPPRGIAPILEGETARWAGGDALDALPLSTAQRAVIAAARAALENPQGQLL